MGQGAERTDGRRARLALLAAGLGVLMPALDATAVTVALPGIQRDLGSGLAELQWVLSAYLVAAAASVIPLGRAADRVGHRRCFLASLLVFGLASGACAVAPDICSLIAARFAQGVGAGALFALSMVVVRRTAARERFGWASSAVLVLSAVGTALGPILGGLLTEAFDWRWIFLVNLPLAAVALSIGRAALPAWRGELALRPRIGVSLVFAAAIGTVVVAVIEVDRWGLGAATLVMLCGAVLLAGAVFARDARGARSLVDLSLFRRRTFSGASIAAVASYATLFALLFLLAISFQSLDGDTAFVAGLKLLPYSIAFMLAAPGAGRLVDRIGPGPPMVSGFVLIALASAALVAADGLPDWIAMSVAGVYGVGQAGVMTAITPAALRGLRDAAAGTATSVTVTARYLGAALGVAVTGAIYQAVERHRADELADAARGAFPPAERAEVQELLAKAPDAREHLAQLPSAQAEEVLAAAKQAYAAGVDASMALAAVVALVAAAAAALLVWRRGR